MENYRRAVAHFPIFPWSYEQEMISMIEIEVMTTAGHRSQKRSERV